MKRKCLLKSICLVCLSMVFMNLTAQAYHSMPSSNAQWDITRCWYFYPGGWHDEYSVRLDGSDTILNGKVYKKLEFITHHAPGTQFDSIYSNFLGGMREANRQVFFFSEYLCIDTIERMLYDFNEVQNGDTIFTQVLTNGLTQFIPHIVTSLDSVQVGADYHRRINLRDENDFFTESWTEGLGSTLGLIYPSYWLLTDNSYDLNCFYDQGQLQYTNPNPGYSFCQSPLPDINCDLNTSIPPAKDDTIFKIYPNPSFDIVNIETTTDFHQINIINALGEKIMTCGSASEIEIYSLPPGFYLFQFTGNDGRPLGTLKFVKM